MARTLRAPTPARSAPATERAYYDESRRVYGSWFASVYDLICLPLRRLRRRVATLARIAPGARVIDVATGTGAQARAFADAGAAVVGIDLSVRMLAIARRKHRGSSITFIQGDATTLPVPAASFDVACISFALHEMPASVRARVLADLARVVRVGGTVVVVDYAPPRGFATRLVSRGIALFEPPSFGELLREDLAASLARAHLTLVDDRRSVFGVARVAIATRTS